jgi:hypothetical protein
MAVFKVNESFLHAIEAGADLTTSLNRLVTIDASGVVQLAGAAAKALGTIYEVPLSATSPFGPATIQIGGIAKMVASAAINPGNRVNAAASGKIAVGATNPVGIALESAAGDNSVIAVAMVF